MRQPSDTFFASVIAVGGALLAGLALAGWNDPLNAGQALESAQPSKVSGADAGARARASASSSARATTTGEGTKCRSHAVSSAEAQAGEEYSSDKDEDVAMSEDGSCSSKAESGARAVSGQTKKR